MSNPLGQDKTERNLIEQNLIGQNLNEQKRDLSLRINRAIWNNQQFQQIPERFTEDFTADYSPRVVRNGRNQIKDMVRSAHKTFAGFKKTVHSVVADNESIVLQFTISGTQGGGRKIAQLTRLCPISTESKR